MSALVRVPCAVPPLRGGHTRARLGGQRGPSGHAWARWARYASDLGFCEILYGHGLGTPKLPKVECAPLKGTLS